MYGLRGINNIYVPNGTGRDSIITRSVRPNWASDVPTKKVVCPSSTLTPTLQESRFQQGEGLFPICQQIFDGSSRLAMPTTAS
eukprot:g22572.t1